MSWQSGPSINDPEQRQISELTVELREALDAIERVRVLCVDNMTDDGTELDTLWPHQVLDELGRFGGRP
jgi:hypothetical protein